MGEGRIVEKDPGTATDAGDSGAHDTSLKLREEPKPSVVSEKTETSTVTPESESESTSTVLAEAQEPSALVDERQATAARLKQSEGEQIKAGNLPALVVEDGAAEATETNSEVKAEPGTESAKAPEATTEVSEKSETRLEDLPALTGDDLDRSRYLQTNLSALLPKIWKAEPGDDPKTALEQAKKDMEDLVKRVEEEKAAGKFGPATKEAYQKFVDWFEKDAVPGSVLSLSSMGIPLPPNCPCELPNSETGRPIDPQLLKTMFATEDVKFSSGLASDRVPTDGDLDVFERGLDWLDASNKVYENTVLERQKEVLTGLIRDGLPQEWQMKEGDNLKDWVSAAGEMVDLASRTRNYVEAMHSMAKEASGGDFPFKLPPGSSITIEIDGEQHVIKAGEEAKNRSYINDKNGTITEVDLDLPKDLRQSHPVNAEKIGNMRDWLDSDTCDAVESALVEYLKVSDRPDSVIMYGDQEIHDGPGMDIQGRFNSRGELLSLVNASDYNSRDGEHIRDLNLLGYDFSVQKTDDGKILVEQEIQAWDMPIYAYQNIRAFGDKVGNPMSFDKPMPENFDQKYESFEIKVNGESRTLYRNRNNEHDIVSVVGDGADRRLKEVKLYEPNQFVPIRSGGKMEIMKASQLGAFHTNEALFYYGEKSLMVALDAAMLVSGTIEVGAAFKAARMATAGMQLGGRALAWEVAKGGTRVAVAGAGIFNNAGAREHEWGQTVNTARGLYFLGDISQGLIRGGIGALRSGEAARTLSSAEKVHSVIYGTKGVEGAKAVEGAEVLKGMGWLKTTHQTSSVIFRVTEGGFVPIIGRELYHQVGEINTLGARNGLEDAVVQIGDGRGLQAAEKGDFDPKNEKSVEGARTVMDSYSDTLTSGRSQEVSAKIKEIFEGAKEVLGPDATEEQKAAYKAGLIREIGFTPEEIKQLEQARRTSLAGSRNENPDSAFLSDIHLTEAELGKLLDPSTRGSVYPKEMRELAERMLAGKDKDVRTAAILALTYVGRDADGEVSQNLGTATQSVPEYRKTVHEEEYDEYSATTIDSQREITVPSHDIPVSLSLDTALRMLHEDFLGGDSGSRKIATGDLLMRTGNIDYRQYGAVLQDVLRNPNASREDKMHALADVAGPRFAAIADGIRYEDSSADKVTDAVSVERSRGERFGLSFEDLKGTLNALATNKSADADVRAMASAMVYGLSEPNAKSRNETMRSITERWASGDKSFDGKFAEEVKTLLLRDMNASIPAAGDVAEADRVKGRRLDAALALSRLADPSDKETRDKINETIASSFSTTDGALALRVLGEMVPDRIRRLEESNPDAAAKLRDSAISMIRPPKSLDEQDVMVGVLDKLDELMVVRRDQGTSDVQKQEQIRRLGSKLIGLINPYSKDSNDQSLYAKWYPELRRASIDALSEFGVQGAKEAIRLHLGQSGTVQVGDQQVRLQEPDAAVRLSAIKALQRLNDTDFPRVSGELVLTEKDPRVSRELREVRFLAQQIEPGTPKWDEVRQRYANKLAFSEVIGKQIGDYKYETYLQDNFPLLDASSFERKAYASAEEAASDLWPFNDDDERKDAITAKESARRIDWDNLVRQAGQSDTAGLRAKATLFNIIDSNGALLGPPGNTINVGSFRRNNYNWVSKAADALKDLSGPGRGHTEFTSWAVRRLLEEGDTENNPTAQTALLDAWKGLYQRGAVTREQYAVTLGNVLYLQLDNALPGDRSERAAQERMQTRVLDELAAVKHREIFPIFDAVAHGVKTDAGSTTGSQYESVRNKADRLLSDFQDSVDMMWQGTVADKDASSAERAERVRKALEGEPVRSDAGQELRHASAEKIVQEIFNAYKGFEFSGEGDKGLHYLRMAMNGENERVRLAAAKVIAESNLNPDGEVKREALETLLALSTDGSKPRYREDASRYIERAKSREFGLPVQIGVDALLHRTGWMGGAVKPLVDASPAQRAEHIASAISTDDGSFNNEKSVEAIISASKGLDISTADDARRKPLQDALSHENARVKLTAAWMLSQSGVDTDRDLAVGALADMAVSSKEPASRTEAAELLRAMIATGKEADRVRARKAWNEAYEGLSEDAMESAEKPPSDVADSQKAVEYFKHASPSELAFLVENGSRGLKWDVLKSLYNLSDEGLQSQLREQAAFSVGNVERALRREQGLPEEDLTIRQRSMIHTQSTIACHQQPQSSNIGPSFSDYGSLTGRPKPQPLTFMSSQICLNAMNDVLLSRSRTAGISGSEIYWNPVGGTERPKVSGPVGSISFAPSGEMSSAEIQAILRYIKESK